MVIIATNGHSHELPGNLGTFNGNSSLPDSDIDRLRSDRQCVRMNLVGLVIMDSL